MLDVREDNYFNYCNNVVYYYILIIRVLEHYIQTISLRLYIISYYCTAFLQRGEL